MPGTREWRRRRHDSQDGDFYQPESANESISLHNYDNQDDPSIDDVAESPKPKGWIKGVYLCAWSNAGIFLLNLILTMTAYRVENSNASNAYQNQSHFYNVLYQGKCSISNAWSTWLQVVINILSTAMLATSNYCMQCLSAPSREDINRAHAQRTWLDIGTFSARNLLLRSRKQQTLWLLLLVTSTPIHLIYNSVILSSLGVVNYGVAVAPIDFGPEDSLMGPVLTGLVEGGFDLYMQQTPESLKAEILEGKLENLTVEQCVNEHAVDYPIKRGNLVLMVDTQDLYGWKSRFAGLSSPANVDRYQHMWMCSGLETLPPVCDKERVAKQAKSGNWSVYGHPWVDLDWTLHAERPDGTRVRFWSWNTLDILRGIGTNSALVVDVETLRKYLSANEPKEPRLDADGRRLRDFLDDPANWKNATWAANADFDVYGSRMPFDAWDRTWVSPPARVHYCLSKKMEESCQLSFSLPIAMAVLICNAIKVACMFLTARQERPEMLFTVGDAMASFLECPDPYTTGRCMMSKDNVVRGPESWQHKGRPLFQGLRLLFTGYYKKKKVARHRGSIRVFPGVLPNRRRWLHGAGKRRWCATIACTLAYLIITSLFLNAGLSNIRAQSRPTTLSYLWQLGLANPNSATKIGSIHADPLIIALLVNTPQVVLSTIYLLWNHLFTRMLLSVEYNDFASERKALRVSSPQGDQRSTYFLSLPYRYAIPLAGTSTLLHWLVSQSFYSVQIVAKNTVGQRLPTSTSTVGYSPVAMIFSIAVLALTIVAMIVLGMRKLKAYMPIAGTCSAAISAACHPPVGDGNAALKPVMWGEIARISVADEDAGGRRGYAHCSFTSKDVNLPSLGRLYC